MTEVVKLPEPTECYMCKRKCIPVLTYFCEELTAFYEDIGLENERIFICRNCDNMWSMADDDFVPCAAETHANTS